MLFCGAAALAAVVAAFAQPLPARLVCALVAFVLVVASLMFTTLTVRDAGDHLDVRYGPLRLLGTKVAYAAVRSLRRARSKLIDGWGIHWIPGRGWTFNLWGRDCIEVETTGRLIRIGTDDPDGLAGFLASRTGASLR